MTTPPLIALSILLNLLASDAPPPSTQDAPDAVAVWEGIRANRTEIQAGESVDVTWSAGPGTSPVFISGLGLVPRQGTRIVQPVTTTTYTLIAVPFSDQLVRMVKVVVHGDRGGFVADDDERFGHPLTADGVGAYSAFLARVETTLQDEMQLSIRCAVLPNKVVRFATSSGVRADLVGSDELAIAARRVAYLVDIEPVAEESGAIKYSIKTLMEYRRRGEATWRLEANDALHRKAADTVRSRLR